MLSCKGPTHMCLVPFPKATPLLGTKEYRVESKIQPQGNMGAGKWRMPYSALGSRSQFYCVCIVSGRRHELLFLGGFCGILSPHHKNLHLSCEAIGMGLSYLVFF